MKSTRILAILVIALSPSFANAFVGDFTGRGVSLQQILENDTHCVSEICGNKIHLKADNLFPSEKGIYKMK